MYAKKLFSLPRAGKHAVIFGCCIPTQNGIRKKTPVHLLKIFNACILLFLDWAVRAGKIAQDISETMDNKCYRDWIRGGKGEVIVKESNYDWIQCLL